MKSIIIFAVFVIAESAVLAKPDGQYTSKYDKIDIKSIVTNKRLLKGHFECLMNRGTCTPEATELKRVLPEAIQNKCDKCTDKQKEGAEYVLKYLYENETEMFKELESVYDPDGEYKKRYTPEIEKTGYKL